MPPPGIYPGELQSPAHKHSNIIFSKAPTYRQLRCPSSEEPITACSELLFTREKGWAVLRASCEMKEANHSSV
jgi:hypothetical protein